MEKSKAQKIVKVLAIYFWFLALSLLSFLLFAFFNPSEFDNILKDSPQEKGFFVVLIIVLIIVLVLFILTGFGLWKMKNWARRIAITLGIFGLLNFPIGTAINIAVLYFLTYNEDTKSLFH